MLGGSRIIEEGSGGAGAHIEVEMKGAPVGAKGSYEIVCVETEYPGCHITHVGTHTGDGKEPKRWAVKKVRKAIKTGSTFYIGSERASVKRYKCGKCGAKTIRSEADGTEADNLDKLSRCCA